MNYRSLLMQWLAPAMFGIAVANTVIGHEPLHIDQPIDVSFVFPPEFPAASGSVSASTAHLLNSYVIK